MSGDPRNEMAISEAELRSATRDLDELHRATFPAVRAQLDDVVEHNRSVIARVGQAGASRRGLLVGGLTLAGGAALAACGGSTSGASGTSASASASASSTASPYTGDLRVVALAAALENLAVAAYAGALRKAAAGAYGTVAPAFAQFATTVGAQHADHAKGWNAVLTGANLPAVSGTPLKIASGEVAKLNATTSVMQVAQLALSLENGAASTYTFAVANVTDAGGIATAATIAPVEAQHAAILNFILGQYPVPESFLAVTDAVKPDQLTA